MKDLCIVCLADKYRSMSFQDLLDLSLPFAEVTFDGTVHVAKAESTAGVLNFSTCSEQLLYEVGDPGAYITPDVVSFGGYTPIKSVILEEDDREIKIDSGS